MVRQRKRITKDRSIEAYNQNKKQVQIIEAGSRANALRADKVGDEIGVQYVILGGGDEYERIDAIKNTQATFILPLNFPKAYDVENTFLNQLSGAGSNERMEPAPWQPNGLSNSMACLLHLPLKA